MSNSLREHWPEYLIEAAGACLLMLAACAFGVLLRHPSSPVVALVPAAVPRRALAGALMAATAAAIIYSPWGRRSGAHFNPSKTLTFFRLGKVKRADAVFYVAAQFAGAVAGMLAGVALLGAPLADPAVHYVTTVPGCCGAAAAFAAEVCISFLLMAAVLTFSNAERLRRWTGFCVAVLAATYVTVEAPVSGTSMNPARSFSSALAAQAWASLWIYFIAPPAGMLLAAEFYTRLARGRVRCAKLQHDDAGRCIFNCDYAREAVGKKKGSGGRRPGVGQDGVLEATRSEAFETAKLLLASGL